MTAKKHRHVWMIDSFPDKQGFYRGRCQLCTAVKKFPARASYHGAVLGRDKPISPVQKCQYPKVLGGCESAAEYEGVVADPSASQDMKRLGANRKWLSLCEVHWKSMGGILGVGSGHEIHGHRVLAKNVKLKTSQGELQIIAKSKTGYLARGMSGEVQGKLILVPEEVGPAPKIVDPIHLLQTEALQDAFLDRFYEMYQDVYLKHWNSNIKTSDLVKYLVREYPAKATSIIQNLFV